MSVLARNVVALFCVVAFFGALDVVLGRLAYEGHDVNLPELAIVGLLIAVSVVASIMANRTAFSGITSSQTRLAARGGAIAVGCAIYALVGFLANVHV